MKKHIASLLSGTVALTLAGTAYAAPVRSAEQAHKRGSCPASLTETHDYDGDGLSDSCDLTVFLVKNDARGGLSLELAPSARVDSMMIADISNQTQEAVYWSLELEGQRGVTARQQDGWVTPGDSQSISLDIDLSSVEPGALLEQSVTLKVGGEVHHIPLAIAVKNAEARAFAGTCNYSTYLDSIKVVTGQGGLEGDAEVELFTSLQTPTGNVANDWPSAGGYMRIAVGATKYINIYLSAATVATGANVNLPVNFSIREDDDTSGDDWGSASGSLAFNCAFGTNTAYSTTRVQDDSGGKYDVVLRSTWTGN